MEQFRVIFDEAARSDLRDIFDYVEARAGAATARRVVEQLFDCCMQMERYPERGTRRDDIRPGFRTIGFRRRATILFRVDLALSEVIILGVYYGGRDMEALWRDIDRPSDQ